MARKVEIPESLKSLLPEAMAETVIVGNSAYELLPLTEGQCERVSTIIGEIGAAIVEKQRTLPENVAGTQSVIEILISNGRLRKILVEALDLPDEDIAKLTIQQMALVAGVMFKQNFELENLPEESRKNVERLLMFLGVRKDMRSVKMMEDLLGLLETEGPIERVALMELMQKNLGSSMSMKHLNIPTAGTGSTSKGSGSESAKSPEESAISLNEKTVTSSARPSGRRATEAEIAAYKERKLSTKPTVALVEAKSE